MEKALLAQGFFMLGYGLGFLNFIKMKKL